jgi:hypothetical protein
MTVRVENQPVRRHESLVARRDAAVAQLNERGYAIVDRQADATTMDRLIDEVRPWAERAERLQLKFFGGGIRKVESVIRPCTTTGPSTSRCCRVHPAARTTS